ncbi:MAG: hypothetical protein JST98_06430, partial [Bacteroidetes bacterium]|nr:hypothetical protein [Bacteroidota bacterium]
MPIAFIPRIAQLHPGPAMNLYSRKQRWKLVLALLALAIVGASLWYSNRIVGKVRQE